MRHRGFTLIELMIATTIIGILAAIAIPNYLKFQCKSKARDMGISTELCNDHEKATLIREGRKPTGEVSTVEEPEMFSSLEEAQEHERQQVPEQVEAAMYRIQCWNNTHGDTVLDILTPYKSSSGFGGYAEFRRADGTRVWTNATCKIDTAR